MFLVFFFWFNIFIVAFLFRGTLCQYYRYVLKEKNVQRAYHLYYFLLMSQDIFLFELNFKKEKIKRGLHVLFRPEITENQLVGGRQITIQRDAQSWELHKETTLLFKLCNFLYYFSLIYNLLKYHLFSIIGLFFYFKS